MSKIKDLFAKGFVITVYLVGVVLVAALIDFIAGAL